MVQVTFTLNGQRTTVDVSPGDLLSDVLREQLGVIGVKIGCAEGECGACTVIIDGKATLSCIYPAIKANAHEITTIEGLCQDRHLNVIQQAFVDAFASQCGYCTPGMIMAAKALLDENPAPSREQIMEGISGNICRCTGYYQIVDAIQLAAKRLGEEQR